MEAAFEQARQLLIRPNISGVFRASKRRKAGEWITESCIAVAVKQKLPAGELPEDQLIPSEIGGVATDVIQLNPRLSLYSPVFKTVCGGISIGNSVAEDAGTLGGIFYDQTNECLVGLTNFHVLAAGDTPMVPDAYVVHPAGTDNGTMDATQRIGLATRYIVNEYGDACIFTLTKPAALSQDSSHVVLDGVATPSLSDILEKIGRTTGLTQGEVVYLGDVDVSYETQGYGTITMTMAGLSALVGETDAIADSGDSGAVWYDTITHAGKLLHVAHDPDTGIAYGCLLGNVLSALNCAPIDAQLYERLITGTLSVAQANELAITGTLSVVPSEFGFVAKAFVLDDGETTFATFDEWAQHHGFDDGDTFLENFGFETEEEFIASFLTTDEEGEESQKYASTAEFLDDAKLPSVKDALAERGLTYA